MTVVAGAGGFSSVLLQLPFSPMRVFARGVELPIDVTVQSPHDADRAIMVGPLNSTAWISASTAAYHSSSRCSVFESFWICLAASSRVTRGRWAAGPDHR